MSIQLTPAEQKILELLWEEEPLTMTQITHRLAGVTGWTKHTVISILKRMLDKGTLRMEDQKPAKLYYPLVQKSSVVAQETQSFLSKVFGGDTLLMMSTMVESGKLNKQEIDELLAILQHAKGADTHE